MKRTIGITIFGWITIVGAFFSIFLVFKAQSIHGNYALMTVLYALILLITGIGLLKLKAWARILLFCVMSVKIVSIIIRSFYYFFKLDRQIVSIVDVAGILVLAAFIFWFFNRKCIKQQFR